MPYGVCAVDIDAQQLAQQRLEVLPVALRIAAAAAIAQADVAAYPSGPKASVPPLWLANGLRDDLQHPLGARRYVAIRRVAR